MPRKTVSIRGLDLELYHEVFSMAKRDGKRVSDVVNSALKVYVENAYNGQNSYGSDEAGLERFVLRNDGDVNLSKQDVIGLEREVGVFSIENSGHMVFDKDIDRDALKHIERIIIHSGTVEVPRNLYPHFILKSEIHGKLEKY
ncbi:hypothetical protein AC482_00115 [miscellaneous Crenarchaeota group-15 archaeon DG-45]|uniref:Uncharacterized protein n=1 Tax=miscellaneous Crenarchaeota group-15 archaeon DG-45 TaxID=1685127 RepID=A0A0M0BTB2_9ARCH|nr:MAG: hypothetical protein AC482_00115 [miscellaneous Crenarchaeota group-15 archaeon DG-45]